MGVKSRGNYAQGLNVSEERWNQIFGGKNESKIGSCNGVSDSSINVLGEITECDQEKRIREGNHESECKAGTTAAGNPQATSTEDTNRISSIDSGSSG